MTQYPPPFSSLCCYCLVSQLGLSAIELNLLAETEPFVGRLLLTKFGSTRATEDASVYESNKIEAKILTSCDLGATFNCRVIDPNTGEELQINCPCQLTNIVASAAAAAAAATSIADQHYYICLKLKVLVVTKKISLSIERLSE